jgi:hypothetical protein
MTQRKAGWDARAISEIAKRVYGGYSKMFEHHNWPERGAQLMTSAPKNILRDYGSVEKFVSSHIDK